MWTCLKIYEAEGAEPCLVLTGFTQDEKEADAQLYAFGSGNFTAPVSLLSLQGADGVLRVVAWADRSRVADMWAWAYAEFPGFSECLAAQILPILTLEPERGYGAKDVLTTIYAFEAETTTAVHGEDNG